MEGAGDVLGHRPAGGLRTARALGIAAIALTCAGVAFAALVPIAPFSGAAPGRALAPGWEEVALPRIRRPDFALVQDEGTTVLRIVADDAAGSVAHRLAPGAPGNSMLAWRWKVDRVVEGADLARKDGDDFAARVYVTFDVPEEALSLGERVRIRLAKLFYGADLPTAAICYVWDNRHPVGTSVWNAYTSRVRMVVLRSGASDAGRWASESRDVGSDFRQAFGQSAPAITAIALSADTDQTHER
ncbi:MAG TPA: DUF3047 domain-containing protein, partial [Usitatibacter sp.]|nr:DUF3047 domain-containing protein [Usitatibacter sp.]